MTHEVLTRIHLQPGQAWRMAADARTAVQVLHGRVVLGTLADGLAPGLPAAGIPLCEGQAHRLERAGWIEVLACGDAEILSYREPGWLARAARAWRAWAGGWSGAHA